MSENRRNIAIGLTVIAGLVMLCGLIVLFAGLPQLFTTGYEIRMHFWQTHDIITGDPIYLRGKRVGLVTDVGFTDDDPRKGVTIVAKVDSDIILPRNVEVKVFTKGLVGKGYLTLIPPPDDGKEVFFGLWKFHSIYPHEILTSFFRKKILKITGGNRTKAADLLGTSRKTLWKKINMYNLDA